jgi:DNA-binding response OmpR family regulator
MRRRILVVEDEMLIALHIEDMITQMGFEVVGPAMRLGPALEMARSESLDGAVLDVNLANEKSFPVADALRERGIPFLFATGYGSKGLDDAYRDVGTIQKPFQFQDLERAIHLALGDG